MMCACYSPQKSGFYSEPSSLSRLFLRWHEMTTQRIGFQADISSPTSCRGENLCEDFWRKTTRVDNTWEIYGHISNHKGNVTNTNGDDQWTMVSLKTCTPLPWPRGEKLGMVEKRAHLSKCGSSRYLRSSRGEQSESLKSVTSYS